MVFVSEHKILVDIDFKPLTDYGFIKLLDDFAWKMYFVSDILKLTFTDLEVYETAKGWHIYLTCTSEKPLTPLEIIIIQLALGSDYKRELFNLRRARAWLEGEELDEGWNVLYRYKYKSGSLVSLEKKTDKSRKFRSYVLVRYKTLLENNVR